MKTAEERVQEYLSKYVKTFNRQQERELIKLLKEQDRLTREACCKAITEHTDGGLNFASLGKDEACQLILNTKAV